MTLAARQQLYPLRRRKQNAKLNQPLTLKTKIAEQLHK